MSGVEFSRPVRRDDVGRAAGARRIEADAAEREALAARFGLASLGALSAELTIEPVAGGAAVAGRVLAEVEQPCVVTGEPVAARIDEPFAVRFIDSEHFARVAEADEEVEIAADDLDVLPIEHGIIDLGELVAQTLALALPPYPRAAGADAAGRAEGVIDDAAAKRASGPFAALAGLRRDD